MKHVNQRSCTVLFCFFPESRMQFLTKQFSLTNTGGHTVTFINQGFLFKDYKKKTRFILKYLCHDFGPRRQVLCQDLPSQIDYPPPTRSTNEPRNKRTYTVLQHKQDVLKPRQVAQKAFIHVGLCVSSRNKCVIGLRDHSWKILGPEPRLVLKAITTAAAPQRTPGG